MNGMPPLHITIKDYYGGNLVTDGVVYL
jgi:hypothetical protein